MRRQNPVVAGRDEAVLQVLAVRRFDDLPRLAPSLQAEREHWAGDLAAALSRLCAVHASYWDHDWRREHRGFGRYPEPCGKPSRDIWICMTPPSPRGRSASWPDRDS